MSRGRALVLGIVVAVLSVAITAAVLIYLAPDLLDRTGNVADRGGDETAREVVFNANDTLQVVVALQRLPRGFQIPPNAFNNAVGVREWPAAAVPVDAVIVEEGQNPETVIAQQIVGKIVRTDVEREGPLLRAMLVDNLTDLNNVGSDTAALLPQGMVAISMPIDKFSGVAYGLQAGDHVDLIFSFVVVDVDEEFQTALPNWVFEVEFGSFDDGGRTSAGILPVDGAALGRIDTIPPGELANVVPSELQRPRLVSQRAVTNVMVLHVGEFPQDGRIVGVDSGDASVTRGEEGAPVASGTSAPDVVTLGVLPQDAVVITWAINAGVDINMVVRSVQDVPNAVTTSVTLQYIFETYNVTLPPRLPYSLEPSLRVAPDEQVPAPEGEN